MSTKPAPPPSLDELIHTLVKNAIQDAMTDVLEQQVPRVIERWLEQWPDPNVALTRAEVAQKLKITEHGVKTLIERKELTATQLGNNSVIRQGELYRFWQRREDQAAFERDQAEAKHLSAEVDPEIEQMLASSSRAGVSKKNNPGQNRG